MLKKEINSGGESFFCKGAQGYIISQTKNWEGSSLEKILEKSIPGKGHRICKDLQEKKELST